LHEAVAFCPQTTLLHDVIARDANQSVIVNAACVLRVFYQRFERFMRADFSITSMESIRRGNSNPPSPPENSN
jgi:hypothetical protein